VLEGDHVKKLLVLLTVAGALAVGVLPAAAADPTLCITTDINVAGTALPTNGTTCRP
jgi:hypothetical protein